MAILFLDGFDHYATADIPKKWNNVGSTVTIQANSGRRGGGCMRITGVEPFATKTVPPTGSWVIGFAFNPVSSLGSSTMLCSLLDAGTTQCDLRHNADGTLVVTRNGTVLGTSSYALSSNAFVFIEWKVTIADSIGAGSCIVRVNGSIVLTLAAGADTKNTTSTTANQFRLGAGSNMSASVAEFDDLYLCDQSGAVNNDFLGDVRVDTLMPNATGAFSQFTPSSTGVARHTLVAEATPDTTTFVDGLNVGDRDSYAFTDLSSLTSQTIYGVQVNAAIQKDDAGAKSAATFARLGGTNVDGAATVLGTSQIIVPQVYETKPGGGAWSQSDVNAAEFGVVVTA